MTAQGIPGVSVEATVSVTSWAELGEHLANESSINQRDFLGAFAEVLAGQPIGVHILGERLLLQEKENPDMRATREAVQRLCRELWLYLDAGSH